MMAAAANGTGNLVDEFEEAFQSCLNVLTKDEALPTLEKDEIKVEVDHTILRFIDLARQMEAFFLQKRFLLSALKPELVIKEDTNELRLELVRKEELIKRHHDKITVWQGLLADLQGWAKSPAQGAGAAGGSVVPAPALASPAGAPPPSVLQHHQQLQQQQHLQQQHMQQQQQQQQQQHMQQQHMQQGVVGVSGQQGMFMQAGTARGFVGGPAGAVGAAALQGPLAYLEKTTSNIGMPEGRR